MPKPKTKSSQPKAAEKPDLDSDQRGGFAEERQHPYFVNGPTAADYIAEEKARRALEAAQRLTGRLKIGPAGRVVIPADMRDMMGLKEGDVLLATLDQGQIVLVPQKVALKQAQDIFRSWFPNSGLLSDQLIAERRREAQKEEDESSGGYQG
jgi:AbrB family looped-hinge helix DNA binding protein